ncbi:MAG: hypothetical protein WEF99_18315 [Thermoanaerobaculia bacterium]
MKLPCALFLLLVLLGGSPAAGQTWTDFPVRGVPGGPYQIVSGPDGNLWFTWGEFRIGRMTVDGVVTEFLPPFVPKPIPIGIAAGADGNLWFTEGWSNKIGRITTSGVITEFPLPPPARQLGLITAGPDGNLWFTEPVGGAIGRITPTGAITEFPLPSPESVGWGITTGPDGNLWFTMGDRIGRITPAGVITEFPIPTPSPSPYAYIAAGPDGALWFTGEGANRIGRITTSGEVTEFPIPTPGSGPQGIVAGIDGHLYFVESEAGAVGRITTSGAITEFPVPTGGYVEGITVGPDGALWLALYQADAIGRLSIAPFPCVADARTLCLNDNRFRATVDWRVPSQNRAGRGSAVQLTGDTGYFWFFDSGNVELVLKALDGRAVNGKFWVFYGALSNVEYTITVVDTQTGVPKRYFNPSGTLASVADTSAFSGAAAPGGSGVTPDAASVEQIESRSAEELYALVTQELVAERSQAAPCTPGSTTLCLNQGQFQVEVDWRVPSQGRSGSGMAVPVTGDTGYLWFFSEENVELIVKVLDGRGVNGHYWVFYGALSNVEYTITVTNTQTGAIRVYTNPSGTLASHADTNAF